MHDPNCIFCKIIAGQIPSRKVYEDEDIFAFHDIHPWAPVHFLMVPKLHIPSMAQVQPEHAALLDAVARLSAAYPALRVQPVLGDFEHLSPLPDDLPQGRRIGFFPGSTIGNLEPEEAVRFLASARRMLGEGALFILGVDLVKAPETLIAAYDVHVGTPDDVIASLQADTALARTTDIVFQVHSVDPPHAQILRSIELTATHVAPALGWVRKPPGNATAAPVATPTSATRTEAFA